MYLLTESPFGILELTSLGIQPRLPERRYSIRETKPMEMIYVTMITPNEPGDVKCRLLEAVPILAEVAYGRGA